MLNKVHVGMDMYVIKCESIQSNQNFSFPPEKNVRLSSTHRASIKDSDKTSKNLRLTRVFDRRTCQFLPFVGHNSYMISSQKCIYRCCLLQHGGDGLIQVIQYFCMRVRICNHDTDQQKRNCVPTEI